MSKVNKEFSDFLKMKRIEQGFRTNHPVSQSEMARWIGIPQGSLSQYELGTRLPNDENKHILAAKLGTEVYEILGGPIMMPDNPYLKSIAEDFTMLTEDTQKRFAGLIKDEATVWEEKFEGMAGEAKL